MEEIRGGKSRKRGGGFFRGVLEALRESLKRRKGSLSEGVCDLLSIVVGFVFARCHLIFGAYPLGLAFVAVLPSRVWLAALGTAVGSLTMGRAGIIYAMISLIVVFLRVIISGTDKSDGVSSLFREGLLLRMSAATVGGFIAAVYEIMLSGFSLASVAFGASMVLLPPITVFALSGLFDAEISFSDILLTDLPLFSRARVSDSERYSLIFYQCSALLLIFLVSLSFAEYSLLGISAAYVFTSLITLTVAKRFGALRGAAVGFAAAVGISGELAVAFALAGLAAGVLFKLGLIYALVGSVTAASLWGAYVGGLQGLLTLLPELSLGTVLAYPILTRTRAERSEEVSAASGHAAADMVGTMALSYRSKYTGVLAAMEAELSGIASVIQRYSEAAARPTPEELFELVSECISGWCSGCHERSTDDLSLCELGETEIVKIATILYTGGRVSASDFDTLPDSCEKKGALAESVNRAASILAREKFASTSRDGVAGALDVVARLIGEARSLDDRERSADEELSERLSPLLTEAGLSDGVIRVFGKRRRHLILAAEDESGERITSPALRSAIERTAGIKLGAPEYFRRGKMALMECSQAPTLTAECAIAEMAGSTGETSGDSARAGECRDGRFFALISDGMGSGEAAKSVSTLVCDFLTRSLEIGTGCEPGLKLLNRVIKGREGECSATVDLFTLDLMEGEAIFLKSGAAPSFIKRDGSIFRIRSRTAPLGLLKELDLERVRAEVEAGDYVIMFSDGVCTGLEDAPWLLELLSRSPKKNLREYAEHILFTAKKNGAGRDDMTVAVIRINKK